MRFTAPDLVNAHAVRAGDFLPPSVDHFADGDAMIFFFCKQIMKYATK